MEELCEFYLLQNKARKFLGQDIGILVNDHDCKIVVNRKDPLFHKICDLSREHEFLISSWRIFRKYKKYEIESSKYFKVCFKAYIQTAGRECGTKYDESNACNFCGANSVQQSDFFLDVIKIPQKADFARTVSREWIISERFKIILDNVNATGFNLEKVNPSKRRQKINANWYHLIVTSPPLEIHEDTIFGLDPTNFDKDQEFVCPLGHTKGLNILSELIIKKETIFNYDFLITKQLWGTKFQLLRPYPGLIISKNIYDLYTKNKMNGSTFEIVHFR